MCVSVYLLKTPRPFFFIYISNCFHFIIWKCFEILFHPPPHTHTRTDTPNLPILYIRSKKCCCTVRISLSLLSLTKKNGKTFEKKKQKQNKNVENEVNKRKIKIVSLLIYFTRTHTRILLKKNCIRIVKSWQVERQGILFLVTRMDVLCVCL